MAFDDLFNIQDTDPREEDKKQSKDPEQERLGALKGQVASMQDRVRSASEPTLQDLTRKQLSSLTGQDQAMQTLKIKKGLANMVAQTASMSGETNLAQVPGQDVAETDIDEDVDIEEATKPLTKAGKGKIEQEIINTKSMMADTMSLYGDFKPEYFTTSGKWKLWLDNKAKEHLGEGDYFLPHEENQKRNKYFMRAGLAHALFVKFLSGTQASDKERENLEKVRINKKMGPAEAEAALSIQLEYIVRHRMAIRQLAKEGYAVSTKEDFKRIKKLIRTQRAFEGDRLGKYLKAFRKLNKGATRKDALMYYMYENGLMGTGQPIRGSK